MRPPQHAACPDEGDKIQRALQQMRQILHAMGLYLDTLQVGATFMQEPLLNFLQDSVLNLGNLLNDLNDTPIASTRWPQPPLRLGLLGMNCLVVGDDPVALRSTVQLLQAWGCEAQGATPADEASALLSSSQCFEMVLCDLHHQDQRALLALLEQVYRLQPKALPIVVDMLSVVCDPKSGRVTRLSRPLAPAKLRACLLASRLRS
ncbi:hypothetical protein D3C81_688840 [compost metagenome]|jgi:hypothetical protein